MHPNFLTNASLTLEIMAMYITGLSIPLSKEMGRVRSNHLVVNTGALIVASRKTRQYGEIVRRNNPARSTILSVTDFRDTDLAFVDTDLRKIVQSCK